MKATTKLTVCLSFILAAGLSASAQNSAGSVNFVMRTSSAFDAYTYSPSQNNVSWMNQHFWRLQTTSPYWDSRLSWFRNAWTYNDLYSTWYGNGNPVIQQHPDWVLKDQWGNWLYLPFACNGNNCSQWALDPGNQNFRNWWISNIKAQMSHGYKGIWIDDVNLEWRTGDGSGNIVLPYDPRTGQTMTIDNWRKYIVEFLEQIRAALPNIEIVHNSLWFAAGGTSNPYVTRQIKACDYINVERGIDDSGLTGGTGQWSVNALLSYIDTVHSLGKHVVFDEYGFYGDYQTAAYFLVSNGGDGLGNQAVTPDHWWSGYDVKLGNALGGRYTWNGLLRRDFQNGIVLLNPPQSPTVSVNLPGSYRRDDGSWVSNITLSAKQGAVLLGSNSTQSASGGSLGDGTYTVKNQSSNMVLDDPAFSSSSGTQMIQWPANGGSNQQWQFTSKGNGYYSIQNVSSGMFLTSTTWNGGGALQQSGNGSDVQLWSVKPAGSGYIIQNKASGMVLDDPGFSLLRGIGIIIWGNNGGSNQIWSIQ